MANQGQNPQWEGTIEEEKGIKVIKNPNEPLYGEITFDLEEDLSIGNEKDEKYMFYGGVALTVDSGGNIFALDRGNYRIQKYNKNGIHIQSIGRRGQGPGDFQSPGSLCTDSEGNIYVKDRRRMKTFKRDGTFKHIFSLSNFPMPWGLTKEGNILGQIAKWEPEESNKGTYDIVLVDYEGEIIKTIASFSYKNPPPIRKKVYLTALFEGLLYSCQINEQFWIYGLSSEYKLFLINTLGDLVCMIEKDEPGEPITKKEKNKEVDYWLDRVNSVHPSRRGEKYSRREIKSILKYPKHKPYFSSIYCDDSGRIYVERFKSLLDKDEKTIYDIFSREGYYLYILNLSTPIQATGTIKNGYLYRVERDEETDYQKIKRYKIKNWEQIKTGHNSE